jgi:hypothetical protein
VQLPCRLPDRHRHGVFELAMLLLDDAAPVHIRLPYDGGRPNLSNLWGFPNHADLAQECSKTEVLLETGLQGSSAQGSQLDVES